MTTTINVSIPVQLKNQAQQLVDEGYFASFSDIVRTALRSVVSSSKYDQWAKEARDEHAKGKTTVLKTTDEVESYFSSLTQQALDESN